MGGVASGKARWRRAIDPSRWWRALVRARWVRAVGTGVAAGAAAFGVRRVPPPPPPRSQDFEDLTARLHRLDVEIARLARSDRRTPALYHRLLATSLAYDAALREACAIMGVAVPGGPPPYDSVARLEAEAGLNAAGLHW
jgi:hypothetical protein